MVVIMLTVMVRNLLANSQPDTPHDDPIHAQITFSKNHVFSIFDFFFSYLGNRGRDPSRKMRREKSCKMVVGNLKFPI